MIYREQMERQKQAEYSDDEFNKQRDQISELTQKNIHLTDKLSQCQVELKNLQLDVMKQFDIDEQRNREFMIRVRELEEIVRIKQQAIDLL